MNKNWLSLPKEKQFMSTLLFKSFQLSYNSSVSVLHCSRIDSGLRVNKKCRLLVICIWVIYIWSVCSHPKCGIEAPVKRTLETKNFPNYLHPTCTKKPCLIFQSDLVCNAMVLVYCITANAPAWFRWEYREIPWNKIN